MTTQPTRRRYPSDLTDRQWGRVELLLPPDTHRGRRRNTELREIVDGINYRWSTGCVWRMLPHDFPPWPTIYSYFRRWQHDGTLHKIRHAVLASRSDSRDATLRSGTQTETDVPVADRRKGPKSRDKSAA